ncbi:MarR family winged helix-turn-helix transcriptional regulator [Nocardioides pacificus]
MRESGTVPEETVEAFITASRALVRVAARSFEVAPEVTLAQHRILVLLGELGARRIHQVADELGVNASNASRLCDRLQRAGLVERARSETDGRVVCVSLTAAGESVLAAVTETRRREIAGILERLPPARIRDMLDVLQDFNRASGEPLDQEWVHHLP